MKNYHSDCCDAEVVHINSKKKTMCVDCKNSCNTVPECLECLGFHEIEEACNGPAKNGKMD